MLHTYIKSSYLYTINILSFCELHLNKVGGEIMLALIKWIPKKKSHLGISAGKIYRRHPFKSLRRP